MNFLFYLLQTIVQIYLKPVKRQISYSKTQPFIGYIIKLKMRINTRLISPKRTATKTRFGRNSLENSSLFYSN